MHTIRSVVNRNVVMRRIPVYSDCSVSCVKPSGYVVFQQFEHTTVQAVYVQRNTDARPRKHCCSLKAIGITYSLCVSVALGIQNAQRMRMRHPRPVWLHNILQHYLLNGTILGRGGLLGIKFVLVFFILQRWSVTLFFNLRRTEQDVIIAVPYRSARAGPLVVSDFNGTWILSTDFRESSRSSNFLNIRPVGTELFHADGRTDVTGRIISFRDFANGPKNSTFCPHTIYVFCVDLRTNSDYFPIQH